MWDEGSWNFAAAMRRRDGTFIGRTRGGDLMLAFLMLLTLAAAAAWLFLASRHTATAEQGTLEQLVGNRATAALVPAPHTVAPSTASVPDDSEEPSEPSIHSAIELEEAEGRGEWRTPGALDIPGTLDIGDEHHDLAGAPNADSAQHEAQYDGASGSTISFSLDEVDVDEGSDVDSELSRSSRHRSERSRRRSRRRERARTSTEATAWWANGTAQRAEAATEAPAPAVEPTPAATVEESTPSAEAPTQPPAAPARRAESSLDDLMDAVVTLDTRAAAPRQAPMQAAQAAPRSDLPAQPARQDVGRELRNIARRVANCGGGTAGVANSSIDFDGSGRVVNVRVTGVPGPSQACVSAAVRQARIPRFSRDRFNVRYPFPIR